MRRILFAIALLIPCATCHAQQPKTGQIHGHVADQLGAVIARSNVFLHAYAKAADKMELATTTDQEGDFTLTLPEGAYDLVVTSSGFKSALQTVVVHAGKMSKVRLILQVQPCDFPSVNCDPFQ
jgi:hypothetical protein